MNQFLTAPGKETKTSTYIAALVFIVIGTFVSGGLVLQAYVVATGKSSSNIATASTSFSNNEWLLLNLLPFLFGFMWSVFVAKQFFKRPFLSFLTVRKSFDFQRFGVGFLTWMLVLLLLLGLQYATDPTSLSWNALNGDFAWLVVITFLLVPIQTGLEEVVFRGFFFQLLGKFTAKGLLVVVINGLVFGALHLRNPEVHTLGWVAIAFYVFSGVFTSVITLMDDGLELSWGFHFANNLFGMLFVTNSDNVFQTDALLQSTTNEHGNWTLLFLTMCLYPVLVVVFAKRYRWTNWKNRLLGTQQA
jgi:membrane protease YdiL (CAAX protease family)